MHGELALSESDFERYSERSVHFFSRKVPQLLMKAMRSAAPAPTLVDVGCGDGHMVWALSDRGLVQQDFRVIGVDISPIRLRRFEALTGHQGLMGEGNGVPALPDETADITLSTMVIEHIPDDAAHARELARITRPGGWLYLSTVIRKPGAWYFRKAPDGRRVLDPTHLREYATPAEVTRMVESAGFVIRETQLTRLVFPIAAPLVRWWHALWPIRDVQRIFVRPATSWLEAVGLPIPRYRAIEILAQRRGSGAETAFAQGAR
jgi:2-polyprenyl-3-methyl-5-hydroxy-6-metoxy-1,4-benzoquinol methylase